MEILLFLAMGLSVFAGVYLVVRRWSDRFPVDQQRALDRLRELEGGAPVQETQCGFNVLFLHGLHRLAFDSI